MIFVGDVAIAPGDVFYHQGFPEVFGEKKLCINLEGAVSVDCGVPDFGTCNSAEWQESFSGFPLAPVFLANNHIADIPHGIQFTLSHLEACGLAGFGAGVDAAGASRAAVCGDYVLLAFGWPVVGCVPAGRSLAGTSRLEGRRVVQQTREALAAHPGKKIVAIMHWNYEFELYPQPAHRKLAMDLIDLGVYAVVGHHPHIVAPVERYRGRTIAYSLGNWAFSYGRFFGGKLRFPGESFHQVALELSDSGDVVHHAYFEPPLTIAYRSSELVGSENFSLRPELEGMSHSEYIRWFKANRRKSKGLPVYKDAEANLINLIKDKWVAARQRLIDTAVKTGLKSTKRRV